MTRLQQQVLAAIGGQAMSTWEIAKALGRKSMQDMALIGRTLRALERNGLVQCQEVVSGSALIRVWRKRDGLTVTGEVVSQPETATV